MRVVGLVSVVGIIGIAGAAGAITLRGGGAGGATETSAGNVSLRQEGRSTNAGATHGPRAPRQLMPTPARGVSVADTEATPAVSTPPVVSVSAPAKSGSLLGEGRTMLADSIYAVRSGDSVVVNFDTQGYRTRRADKFEQMLRTTLPLVYGRRLTTSLDSVPAGALLPSRDVTGTLMSQGVHLTLDNGTKIGLWPQTRDTNDGPLVVAYRIVVER